MEAKKLILLSVAALGLFYVIVDPAGAACLTQSMLGMLADGANGVFQFVQEFFAGV